MKLTRQFQPNTEHLYNLAEGVEVQSAKFGRTQVDIFQEAEPSPIWRGDPPEIVGHRSVRFWSIVVKGECSSSRLTEAGAKAHGERLAWNSEANYRTRPASIEYFHALPKSEEKAEMERFYAILAEDDRLYPAGTRARQTASGETGRDAGEGPDGHDSGSALPAPRF